MERKILENILTNAKNAYKEAILISNKEIEERVLSIITDVNILLNYSFNEKNETKKISFNEDDEVAKVKRRVPSWIHKPTQINSRILNTFMSLSANNSYSISVSLLEKHSGLESDIFYKNYNQMKNSGERNHGKVFVEINGEVKLWDKVADFIVDLYERKIKNEL